MAVWRLKKIPIARKIEGLSGRARRTRGNSSPRPPLPPPGSLDRRHAAAQEEKNRVKSVSLISPAFGGGSESRSTELRAPEGALQQFPRTLPDAQYKTALVLAHCQPVWGAQFCPNAELNACREGFVSPCGETQALHLPPGRPSMQHSTAVSRTLGAPDEAVDRRTGLPVCP
jgi:hypothetical protein